MITNNETFKAKRLAFCVHVDHIEEYISKIYSWELPEEMEAPRFGETLLVENLDETTQVLFLFEREVIPIESMDRKKVLAISADEKICLEDGTNKFLADACSEIEQGIHTPEEFLGVKNGIFLGWRIPAEEQDIIPARRERRLRFFQPKWKWDHLVKEVKPEEIKPHRLYIEISPEGADYAKEHGYAHAHGEYFILGHNSLGKLGELYRGEAQVIHKKEGLVGNLMGNSRAPLEKFLKNPRPGYTLKEGAIYYAFIEGEEELLDGFKHDISTTSVTKREFTLEDGTRCRFVPAMEKFEIFPWMAPGDERVIHLLRQKNTAWMCESQLEEARRHLADDGQVYMLDVLKERAGRFYWEPVVQTTYCYRYDAPVVFNATSTKKEAFEEEPRFATAYVYQSGVNQYQTVSLYQPFWYSPGNYSDYNR